MVAMTETRYQALWTETCAEAVTDEQKRCVGEAEDNANASAWEGVQQFSEEWFRLALTAYEYLIECGVYAA